MTTQFDIFKCWVINYIILLPIVPSVMFYKNVAKVVMTMVSPLRLKGYGGQAGVRFRVSGSGFKG